jgi:hypothetical protein
MGYIFQYELFPLCEPRHLLGGQRATAGYTALLHEQGDSTVALDTNKSELFKPYCRAFSQSIDYVEPNTAVTEVFTFSIPWTRIYY